MTPSRALVTLAVLFRWLFCFFLFPRFLASRSTVGLQYYFDSYREIATSVLRGCGYRLTCGGPIALHRPPGYTLFMMLCQPGNPARCYLWVHLLHGIIGGAATVLTIAAAEAWGLSRARALFAGAIVAFWPFLIWETKITVPENLLVALLPAVMLALPRARQSYAAAVTIGLLAAAAALTHASYQLLVIGIVISISIMKMDVRRKAIASAIVLVTFLAGTVPWIVHNRRAGYNGIATGFGYHYWKGVYNFDRLIHGEAYFRDNDIPATAYVSDMLHRAGFGGIETNPERSEARINAYLDRAALEHAREHLGYTVAKTIIEIPLAWLHQQNGLRSLITAILLAPLFCLAFLGVSHHRMLAGVALPMLIMNAAFAAVFTEAIPMRYTLPLMPLLAILAAGGLRPLHFDAQDDSPASDRGDHRS